MSSNFQKIKEYGNLELNEYQIKECIEAYHNYLSQKCSIQTMSSLDTVCEYFEYLRLYEQEVLIAAYLDNKNKIIEVVEHFKGTINTISVDPKIIFKQAIQNNAVSIILVHNHPSGDIKPSDEDIQFTKVFLQGAQLLNLRIHDHVIIGASNDHFSFKEENLI